MNLDIKKILEQVSSCYALDDNDYIEIDGVTYLFEEVEREDTVDEGKYKLGANIYELMIHDKETNIDTGTRLFFRQSFTKFGDYWNGYEYEYDNVEQVEQKQKTITYWAEVE